MMFAWLLHKIKAFFLIFINLFRRALCCIRKRKRSYCETVPLTHVISSLEPQANLQDWSEWGDQNINDNRPKTVQDYIDQYRQQTTKPRTIESEEDLEEQVNFFENMTPKITKQTKLFIKNKGDRNGGNMNNRLNFIEGSVNVIPSPELVDWDEKSGWDGQQLLDQEAQKLLRQQKRLDRERRLWEQNQKKLEKTSRVLGSKLMT